MNSSVDTLAGILPAWRRSLRADNRRETTIASYELAANQLHAYLEEEGFPTAVAEITTDAIRGFTGSMPQNRSSSTAAQRHRSLQQCFKWLVREGIIDDNPMSRLRPPKIEETPVPVLTDSQVGLILQACRGTTFEAKRDEAIIRLFLDTGCRLNELSMISLADLHLDAQTVSVIGKGRKPRTVPYSANTGRALDRYLRLRAAHRDAHGPWLWLGYRPPKLSDSGIAQLVAKRGRVLGFRLHPHVFRHSFAHNFMAAGGQETDLMRLAGWPSTQMVQRYGASAGMARAHASARRIALGDRW